MTPESTGDEIEASNLPFDDQNLAGFRQLWRVQWARHDFDNLKDQIKEIRDANNDLTSFFGQVRMPDQAIMLEKYDETHRLWPLVYELRKILLQLHRDLEAINPCDPENSAGSDLSIQLVQDQRSVRRALMKHPGMPNHLRADSYVFMAQSHAERSLNPETLLFECRRAARPDLVQRTTTTMQSLECPREAGILRLGKVHRWGAVRASDDLQDDHIVYCARDVSWVKIASLSTFSVEPITENECCRPRLRNLLDYLCQRICASMAFEKLVRSHDPSTIFSTCPQDAHGPGMK